MRLKFILKVAVLVIWSKSNLHAQDVLYSTDGTKQQCRITAVDQNKISFKSLDSFDSQTYTKDRSQYLIAFKDNGQYLVSGTELTESISYSGKFLSAPVERSNDILITNDNLVISGIITSTEGDQYMYTKEEDTEGHSHTIKKNNLTAVIYRNGKHQLFVSPFEASKKLALAKQEVDELLSASLVMEPSLGDDGSEIQGDGTGKTNNDNKSGRLVLGEAELKEFQKKAQYKVSKFGEYLTIIADKSTSLTKGNNTISLAQGLFLNDSSRIEVSNINTGKSTKYTVEKYLKKLRSLKYDEVIVTWTEVSYVSELEKGPDGNYHGVVTFQQIFEAYNDGEVTYQDVTQKNVEVVLKGYSKQIEGVSVDRWDVFLSNVRVEETRN